jgi:hypothetical protein
MADTPETQPKPFVFVLMPFDPSFTDLYELGIKAASLDAGAYCERVDEQIYDESTLQRVYNQIAKADLLVAEMTGRNPNVFYEVGYAHALGKRVILLTRTAEDIPFDLKHYPHVVHGNKISDLKPELTRRVRWAIANPKGTSQLFNPTLECFVSSTRIVGNPVLPATGPHYTQFPIDVNNSASRSIEVISFQAGLLVPASISNMSFDGFQAVQRFQVSASQALYLLQQSFELLPGAWLKLPATLMWARPAVPEELDCTVRLFTPGGSLDYPFRIKQREPKA